MNPRVKSVTAFQEYFLEIIFNKALIPKIIY